MGSFGTNQPGGDHIYRASTAAINAVTKSLAVDLRDKGFIVAVLHPGWVRTDMIGSAATIDTATSAQGLARVILGLGPADSGGFFNYDGTRLIW